ncbi:hypothetical protein PBV87_10490 [Niameybacter massiliensis]|uniref:Uncharacterized protein n=1 Tax=Holtiella tumoricola TaxID=3018743 RepID=A0AA42DNH2_9FIRM|nr:hypothetical protein [Holtiella tumoricola]MDA3731906.1 hypothetical protein [Holtiella tumoricola]
MKQIFVQAIHEKRILEVVFSSSEKGIITRCCVPFDFGPSRRYKDGRERYHFYDLDSPEGKHNLSILPEQVINIRMESSCFEPANYVTWNPNWFVQRDWGECS